jgi:hypothetical protein
MISNLRTSWVLSPPLALVFGAVLAGQSVTVATVGPSGGRLSSDVGSPVTGSLPFGTLVLPATLDLSGIPAINAFLRARIVDRTRDGEVGIQYVASLSVAAPQPPQTYTRSETWDGSAYAPHALAVTLHPDPCQATNGTLRIAVAARGSPGLRAGGAGVLNEVDVDGDGVRDVSLPLVVGGSDSEWRTWARDVAFVLHPGHPRMVGLWSAASAGCTMYGASMDTDMKVSFVDGESAPSVLFGLACGVSISGWYETETETYRGYPFIQRRRAHVSLRDAPPHAPALLLMGVDRIRVPIPGFHCDLLTSPVVALPLSADALGGLDVEFRVPTAVIGSPSFQFIVRRSAPQPDLAASQGLSLSMW